MAEAEQCQASPTVSCHIQVPFPCQPSPKIKCLILLHNMFMVDTTLLSERLLKLQHPLGILLARKNYRGRSGLE